MWHTHHGRSPIPSRDSTWSSSSRNSPFKTIQKGQYMSDQVKTSQTPRKTKRTLWQSPQSQRSASPQNQGTSPVLSQQTRHRPHQVDDWHSDWNTRMWTILHDPGPQRQSLQKEQSSPEAHMPWRLLLSRPPSGKRDRNSPKTIPFKTISPARPNPCPLRREISYMDTRSMMFDEPDTHQTPPTPPPSSPPRHYSPRSPSCSPPALFPSKESSVEPSSEDSSPEGRKRHQSELAFIWPHDVDQGLSRGLSALLAETSPLAPYRLQR